MGRSWKLCRFSVAVLVVVVLAQLAAVAAPGWLIAVEGNHETHIGLFYKVRCETLNENRCQTISFRDEYFRDTRRKAELGRKTIAALDYNYNVAVWRQVLLTSAVGCSLVALLVQLGRRVVDKRHVRIIILSIALTALSAGLMLSVTSSYIVDCMYQMELLSFDTPRDHTYLAFPYSIALALGSVLLQFIGILVLGAHIFEPKVTIVKKPRRMSISTVEPGYTEKKMQPPPPAVKASEQNIPPAAMMTTATSAPKAPTKVESTPLMKTTVNVTSSRINPPQRKGDTSNILSEKL
ncbi:uncharacterized protein LOC128245293 [Mya arenaria]|nr:uncharacterized protein LOC128245293 [Mya arenaria]